MNNLNSRKLNNIKNACLSIAALVVIANTADDIIDKIQDRKEKNLAQEQLIRTTTIPYGQHPYVHDTLPKSIFSESIWDIIKKKWWFENIPCSISYKKNNQSLTIDISSMVEDICKQEPIILKSFWETKTEKIYGLLKYRSEDYHKNIDIMCDISEQWIDILPDDDYWTKVHKIQNFVWWLWYERDLIYLWEQWNLPALGDYQLPVVANLIIWTMDCNNKTGLFVQLCWSNDILVWAGMSQTHVAPVVYTHGSDKMRNFAKSNTSFSLNGQKYKGVVVDPTGSDFTHKQPRPKIVWDIKWDAYKDMQFVIIKPQ